MLGLPSRGDEQMQAMADIRRTLLSKTGLLASLAPSVSSRFALSLPAILEDSAAAQRCSCRLSHLRDPPTLEST